MNHDKHACIKKVPDRIFTIGKIYESESDKIDSDGCWIKDDVGVLGFFSNQEGYWFDNEQDKLRYYHDYFENATSVIRDQKIQDIIRKTV
jgi:hypothetical protein